MYYVIGYMMLCFIVASLCAKYDTKTKTTGDFVLAGIFAPLAVAYVVLLVPKKLLDAYVKLLQR